MKKIFIGWASGAALAAFTAILLLAVLELTQNQPVFSFSDVFIGICFWTVGVFVAMSPTVAIMGSIYIKKKEFRGSFPTIICGACGLLNIWIYAFLIGDPNPMNDLANSAILGAGAIVASITFWKVIEKIEPVGAGQPDNPPVKL